MRSPAAKFLARAAALAACAIFSLAASPPAPKSRQLAPRSTNWNSVIGVTANGSHTLGNPDAPVKLTEFVSYTCPHCAHFHRESDAALRVTLIPKGRIQVTVTNLLRNPVDLTVAMLTSCGDPRRFWVRHNAFMGTQDTWLAKAQKMSPEQQARWYKGEMADRMRAIAGDFDFYSKVQQWGLDRAQADRCLADKSVLDKLRQQQAAAQDLGIDSTPTFVLNGKVQEFHDWEGLSKAISDQLSAQQAGSV
ncbi:MAG TPA: thioredoxin domain-containing protein [Novosphingobium sp.]|nr:thioredoxin domain-containing protein [Novosphingobium sp.]